MTHRIRFIVCSAIATFCFVALFSLSVAFAQESESVPGEHPATAGSVMRFPMEQPTYQPRHAEGILGRHFPNIHGGEAVHFDYLYTGGIFNNARGGAQTRSGTSYVGIFEIGITADTEKLGLWKNGTFYMYSIFSHGPSPSRFVGDYQDVSVFAYETPAQVAEYWYEHSFLDGALKLKGGKQDAGADFFFLESTSDFMHASSTCIPTTGIPTTPDNAWGLAAYLDLTDNLCLKAGFYDAQGNANKFWMSETGDIYSAYQIEYHYSLGRYLPGFAYVGAWYDSSKFDLMNREDKSRTGNYGVTFGLEQMVYRRHICDDEDMRGATVFFQYGDAKQDRSETKRYWGLGVNWLGVFDSRPEDCLGIAVNTVYFSRGFKAQEDLKRSFESTYEIHYRMQLTDNLALQPVFQYVVHPSGVFRNSFVPGLVFQMIF